MSSFRVRAVSVAAALALLVVGASAATAGPAPAPNPGAGVTAQPPLSKESAELAARALAQGAGVQLVPQAVNAAVQSVGGVCPGQGFGVTAANKIPGFVGAYEVFFNQVVTSGVYTATIGLCGNVGTSPPGEITVTGRVGTVNGVFIQTSDSAGNPADRGFHLNVLF